MLVLILIVLLIAIPTASLVLLIRAEKKRDQMDKRILKELCNEQQDEREG
jgi:signal transduction histidine kinase